MKNISLLLFILFSISGFMFSQDLPHYKTDEEKVFWKDYLHPVLPELSIPPPSNVRGMAEWEELQGIIITWTQFTNILRDVVDYAQEEGTVYIICSDSNQVKNYLQSGGVPIVNIEFLITGYNSIWVRDYGPWSAYTENGDSLVLIDWKYNRPRPLDDVTPVFFADHINVPVYQTTIPPNDLIHAGGNFMIDGHGTAFSSQLILEENPGKTEEEIDTIVLRYLNIDRYIKMENLPYDVIHHIDMHMKLLDEETLLVGEYPPGVADGPQIEANLNYILKNFKTCFGRDYKVVRIPMPPDQLGRYPDQNGYYRTYTNSIIINKIVIIPTYELQYDTTAFRIYREAMPGYNIVGINSNAIIPSLGAIHCIVKEVGAFDPVFISHPKIDPIISTLDSIEVNASIKTESGLNSAGVYWTTDTTTAFQYLPMASISNNDFSSFIPAQQDSTEIFYYLSATSTSGKTITKPIVAPEGVYKFLVRNSLTGLQDETSKKIAFNLEQNYPNPFNPSTKIKYTIPRSTGYQSVQLKVYDVLGNKVATLVDEYKPAGSYNIEFDGSQLTSGIYFYLLKVGDPSTGSGQSFIQTRKMILMK